MVCCVCENRPRATRPALPSATHQKSLFSFYAVILIMATLANDGNGDASTASYDDGEEVHPLDAMHPCCLKEAKLRKKALQRYEALAKVDITRIALERTKLEKALPPPSPSRTQKLNISLEINENSNSHCEALPPRRLKTSRTQSFKGALFRFETIHFHER